MKRQHEEQEQEIEANPFSELKLDSFAPLQKAKRKVCPKCLKKRKFFCYTCLEPLLKESPKVNLPINMDIIHHPTECLSKSTAVHAVVVGGKEKVKFIDFPDIPTYNPDETVLLFPSDTSVAVSDLSQEEAQKIKKLVVVDSQWQKTHSILSHPSLTCLKCVKITEYKTSFWRYQHHGDSYLATIEAIYYFFREFFDALHPDMKYDGQYDNLLYYYSFMYNLIQKFYRQKPEINFRHKENYIKYTEKELLAHEEKERERHEKEENEKLEKAEKVSEEKSSGDDVRSPKKKKKAI